MQAERSNITCPHYTPLPGSRKCTSYLDGGGCARPDTFMCTEYLRTNPRRPARAAVAERTTPSRAAPATTAEVKPQRDLFGEVVGVQQIKAGRASSEPRHQTVNQAPVASTPLARPVTEKEIAALEERGVELCVRSAAVNELWLVPAYTGAPRTEMTFRDAATIAAVCAVFPGAEVTRFERSNEKSGGA